MQKSLIERVFPKPRPKHPLLPQYDHGALALTSTSTYHDHDHDHEQSGPSSPSLTRLHSRTSTSRSSRSRRSSEGRSEGPAHSQSQIQSDLHPAPLNASVVHHDDPFLAVDRAAANLQKTIQSLLDFQSEALNGRQQAADDESASQRSATPTQFSTVNLSSVPRLPGSRAVPVRQPRKKKPTLRGARRGLVESMQEFAALKEEELRITEDESTHRRIALEKVSDLETKREAVQHEVDTLKLRADASESKLLRTQASAVGAEIHELEGRLMELKAQQRNLIDRATQLENTTASDLSSYEGTLTAISKETRSFLKRPPVKQSLSPRNIGAHLQLEQDHNMYALRPERRTLELAKEQWSGELDLLLTHKHDVQRERDALLEGARLWRDVVSKVDNFEHSLRKTLKSGDPESAAIVVDSLDSTMKLLQEKLTEAESKHWTLLICAIGAELEAFRQARVILLPDAEPLRDYSQYANGHFTPSNADESDSDVPHADLLGEQSPEERPLAFHPSNDDQSLVAQQSSIHQDDDNASSNESLKATLKNFPSPTIHLPSNVNLQMSRSASQTKYPSQSLQHGNTTYSESEDDDPGPEFLVER